MNARRSLCLATVASLLATPAAAAAQGRGAAPKAPAAAAAPSPGITWAALLGLEDGDGGNGLALRGDAVLAFRDLTPKVRLSWVGSVGFTRFSDSTTVPVLGELEASSSVLKLVPAARLTFPVAPNLDLYADGGLGVYLGFVSVEVPDPLTGGVISDDSTDVGLAMRVAGGATLAVNPSLALGAEVALNPYFGDASDTTFSLMAAALLRF